MKTKTLKTAWVVKGLSIFFVFAPLGNLMFSLRSLGHPLWFRPDVALLLFPKVVVKDQIWLTAIFCGLGYCFGFLENGAGAGRCLS